jgi:hypothetical protein
MNVGDLVEMYGQPGFYGILLRRTNSDYQGKWWSVMWQNGWIFDRDESLMVLIRVIWPKSKMYARTEVSSCSE